MAVAGAIIGIAGLVLGQVSAGKAQEAQEESTDIRRAEANFRNARSRRRQVAEQRRLRATAVAQAESSGISGGSQIGGVESSIGTQGAVNASFATSLQGLDEAQFAASSSFQRATARGNRAGAIGSTFSNLAFKFS